MILCAHLGGGAYIFHSAFSYRQQRASLHESIPCKSFGSCRPSIAPPASRRSQRDGTSTPTAGTENWLLRSSLPHLRPALVERGWTLRLGVNTGTHTTGWACQDTIDDAVERSALTRTNSGRMKGLDTSRARARQTLSHTTDEDRIREPRDRTEGPMGSEFHLRPFHDVALSNGFAPLHCSMPVEAHIEEMR